MSRLRTTLYSLLIALASPLAAGSLSLQVTNPTSSPWRIWGSASLHLADEGAPAGLEDPTGLQIPALGTLQVHLAWEDGPGQARPLFHAESVDAADTMGWTMAPDRIPAGAIQWTLRLQAPSPELLLRSVADPIFLPSPPPPPGNTLAALPPQEPGAGSNIRGNAPSPSPQSLPSEPSSSGGEGPAPSGKDSSVKVYATVEFETRGSSRKITLLDADRPPVVTRMPIQAQGTPAAVEEPCRWAKEGRRRYIMVFPGYRYFVKISGNAGFGRDPLVAFSRVMVLSGPGGEPWNAASLLGSREGAAGPGDPWRFRLRTPDTLPGFQEEAGGRRNCFVFGEVDADVVHGVTSLPIPAEDGDTEPQSVSGKRVQPQEDGDGASQSTTRRKGVLTELTVRNHLGSPCFLRADTVRRMRARQHLLDLGGNLPPIPVPWVKRTDCPATSRFLEIPAGQAVHLEVDPYSQWGVEKRKRVLHLEVPGGTPGATLLAVQGYHPLNSPAAPWQWFLHDSSGREAALLPGLELVRGSILEIRPLEGQDDAGAVPGESKQPLEDEWEEVVEDSGVAPLAGNGSPQGSGPILLPSPQGSPSESSSSGGEGLAPSGKGSSVKVYATLEFETRGSSRTITLLETIRPPMLTRMPIQAQGTPAAAEKLCHWEREGGRRRIRLVPGYRYFAKVSGNSDFSRDPLISYSRVMVLSGPGGEPWNAASLVGSREGAAGPGDPWRFRLRAPDTLPGFQEEAGGRRNCFVFGEVEAGVVHGVTSLPIPAQDGNTGPQSVSRKRVRPQEDGDEASQSNKRKTGVLTEITVRNHLGSPCFLRADDVRRMGIRQYPMDLGGNPLPLLLRGWFDQLPGYRRHAPAHDQFNVGCHHHLDTSCGRRPEALHHPGAQKDVALNAQQAVVGEGLLDFRKRGPTGPVLVQPSKRPYPVLTQFEVGHMAQFHEDLPFPRKNRKTRDGREHVAQFGRTQAPDQAFPDALKALGQTVIENGLQKVVHRGKLEGPDRVLGKGRNEHDRRGIGCIGQDLHAVGSRHLYIKEDHVSLGWTLEPFHEGQPVRKIPDHLAASLFEQPGHALPGQRLIIYDQSIQTAHVFRPLGGCPCIIRHRDE